ncbi:MAG: sulfite exporter TauE/SafE family protein [Bacteroidetes bacterium]|nr:sulfite exporter TauE/SafE family protein [Bacteroidota bacterium]
MFLWTAFILGLFGSLHCAGMCGPIALALPLNRISWVNRAGGLLLYNIGRIFTYVLLGAFFGLLGKGIHLAGFQLWASVIIGSVMIALVLFPMIFGSRISFSKLFSGYTNRLFGSFQRLFKAGTSFSFLTIGLLNGILPCGLVYVGIAGAVNSGDVKNAMIFMALFGLGTFPIMFAISMIGNFLSISVRNMFSKITPYVVILLGILFILRGLSLGIPYVSPKAEALTPVVEKAHKCCHK